MCRLKPYPRFLDFLKDPKTKGKGAYKCRCGAWHVIGAVDHLTALAQRKGYGRFDKRVAA